MEEGDPAGFLKDAVENRRGRGGVGYWRGRLSWRRGGVEAVGCS
jgi:hypothetical protein